MVVMPFAVDGYGHAPDGARLSEWALTLLTRDWRAFLPSSHPRFSRMRPGSYYQDLEERWVSEEGVEEEEESVQPTIRTARRAVQICREYSEGREIDAEELTERLNEEDGVITTGHSTSSNTQNTATTISSTATASPDTTNFPTIEEYRDRTIVDWFSSRDNVVFARFAWESINNIAQTSGCDVVVAIARYRHAAANVINIDDFMSVTGMDLIDRAVSLEGKEWGVFVPQSHPDYSEDNQPGRTPLMIEQDWLVGDGVRLWYDNYPTDSRMATDEEFKLQGALGRVLQLCFAWSQEAQKPVEELTRELNRSEAVREGSLEEWAAERRSTLFTRYIIINIGRIAITTRQGSAAVAGRFLTLMLMFLDGNESEGHAPGEIWSMREVVRAAPCIEVENFSGLLPVHHPLYHQNDSCDYMREVERDVVEAWNFDRYGSTERTLFQVIARSCQIARALIEEEEVRVTELTDLLNRREDEALLDSMPLTEIPPAPTPSRTEGEAEETPETAGKHHRTTTKDSKEEKKEKVALNRSRNAHDFFFFFFFFFFFTSEPATRRRSRSPVIYSVSGDSAPSSATSTPTSAPSESLERPRQRRRLQREEASDEEDSSTAVDEAGQQEGTAIPAAEGTEETIQPTTASTAEEDWMESLLFGEVEGELPADPNTINVINNLPTPSPITPAATTEEQPASAAEVPMVEGRDASADENENENVVEHPRAWSRRGRGRGRRGRRDGTPSPSRQQRRQRQQEERTEFEIPEESEDETDILFPSRLYLAAGTPDHVRESDDYLAISEWISGLPQTGRSRYERAVREEIAGAAISGGRTWVCFGDTEEEIGLMGFLDGSVYYWEDPTARIERNLRNTTN